MKKILMILAKKEFRDLEYIAPKAFFEKSNFEVITTSTDILSIWRFGYEVYHEWIIEEYKNEKFDALVFVWWAENLDLWECENLKKLK